MNRVADVMTLAGADSASAQKFISTARAGARLRGGLGYLASADGIALPDLNPRGTGRGSGNGGSLPPINFTMQVTVNGDVDETQIKRLEEAMERKFAEMIAKYERERRRTRYAY